MSLILYETGKSTTIRRISVRKTSVSRHHRRPDEDPPETPWTVTALS